MKENNKSKTKKKQGRKSKLTPELHAEIILLLKHGNFVETACNTACINKSTFYDSIKKGKKSNHPRNKYKIFQEAVEQAMAWSEARDVANLAKHSEESHKVSQWRLTHRYPKKWGLKPYKDLDIDDTESDDVRYINKNGLDTIKKALKLVEIEVQ